MTTPGLAHCAVDLEVLHRCLQSEDASLAIVAVAADDAGPTASARVGPGFDGGVEMVEIDRQANTIIPLGQIDATVDSSLGGNLPALVLPSGTRRVGSADIRLSDSQRLAFLDFGALAPADRALFRRQVDLSAPGSLSSGTSATDPFAARVAVVRAVAFVGAGLGAVVVLMLGASASASGRSLRRTMLGLGASGTERLGLGARVFGALAVAALAIAALVPLAVVATGRTSSQLGRIWAVPFASVVVAVGVVTVLFATAPSGRQDD